MRIEELCGLLAEPERLEVFAAVVLGAGTVDEVVKVTGRDPREVTRALRRLGNGGLIADRGGRLVAAVDAFKQAVRESLPARQPEPPLDPDPAAAAVLRAFIRGGRLERMPAARGKRRVVLEHIVRTFEPGVRYPEREVNALLRAWFHDHVTLRRYLVDEQLLAREAGVYWRIGGPVLVDTDTDPEEGS